MRRGIRKINWYTRVLLVGVFLMGWPAGALLAQGVRSLTLGEAIQIALTNNIELQRSSNQVVTGELSVQQARSDFYPNLNASASVSEGYDRHVDPITDQTEGRDIRALSVRLSSNVTLFDGFSNLASLEKSKLELAASEESLSQTRQSITFETISRFLQILQDRELLRSEQEYLEAQRQQLKRIEEFYNAGNRSIADVLQQQAIIAQTELRVLAAERNLDVSTLRLLRTIGLELTTGVEIVELSSEQLQQLAADPVDGDSNQLAQEALKQRPDVEAQNRRIDAVSEQVRMARAGYWPSLSLFADAGSNYSSRYEFGGFSDQFFDSKPNATIGLSLSIPIFDRSRTKHNVAQAKVRLADERLGLENLKQEITLQIQQAILDYQTARKQLDVAEAQLRFARQALEAAEERYDLGASTLVELTQSRAQYVEATNDRVEAQYNLLLHRVAIDYYLGDMDRRVALFE